MRESHLLWDVSIDEITTGYAEHADDYQCVLCGERFLKGRVYRAGEDLFDAYGAVRHHVQTLHGSAADFLLDQKLGLTGISENQRALLLLLSEGKNDREIAQRMGIAQSTVRNHRFKLREKEKQAKLFLAMMASLERKTGGRIMGSGRGALEDAHSAAAMVDDRYVITAEERDKTIRTYLDENGRLKQFPAREKKKIIILGEIVKRFDPETAYPESAVNEILKAVYPEDHVTIRRALIEYGFLERSKDCTAYRVKQ